MMLGIVLLLFSITIIVKIEVRKETYLYTFGSYGIFIYKGTVCMYINSTDVFA